MSKTELRFNKKLIGTHSFVHVRKHIGNWQLAIEDNTPGQITIFELQFRQASIQKICREQLHNSNKYTIFQDNGSQGQVGIIKIMRLASKKLAASAMIIWPCGESFGRQG